MEKEKEKREQTEFTSAELRLIHKLRSDMITYPAIAAVITGIPSLYFFRYSRGAVLHMNYFLVYGVPFTIAAGCGTLTGIKILNDFIYDVSNMPKTSKLSQALDKLLVEREVIKQMKSQDTNPADMKPPSNKS